MRRVVAVVLDMHYYTVALDIRVQYRPATLCEINYGHIPLLLRVLQIYSSGARIFDWQWTQTPTR